MSLFLTSSVVVPHGPSRVHPREDRDTRSPHSSPWGNGSTLVSRQPKASNSSRSAGTSMNGSQDLNTPRLVEPARSCPHADPLTSLPASDAPLTVGSYPSAKSFLGMKARELFRNKSESQCDDDLPPPPRLAGLAHDLKTELCVESPSTSHPALVDPTLSLTSTSTTLPTKEPPSELKQRVPSQGSPRRKAGAGPVGGRGQVVRPRQQQLKIMDYNETHHEHS